MTDRYLDETVDLPDTSREGVASPASDIGRSLTVETPTGPIMSDMDTTLGSSVDHYQLLQPLGQGGQATTHVALDTRLQRRVVLKRYHGDAAPERRAAVLNEGRALARVRSRYVAPCLGVEFDGDETILVVEFVPGRPLSELTRTERADFSQSALWVEQIAEGLAEVHACGLVHRDIKPQNIILGDDGIPRLVDFGLAAPLASPVLQSVSGSPPYMAPEQARGQGERIDARTDVFGLGAVLYFLLTGLPPYQGRTRNEIVERAIRGNPVPPRTHEPLVPRSLERICLKAMHSEPANRYASATEFRQALQRQRVGRSRTAKVVLTGLAVALLAAGTLMFWLWRGSSQPDPPQVKSLAIQLFSRIKEDLFESQGILGKTTFTTRSGDCITIEAELSEPAYGFLVAFQPDGRIELLDPENEDVPPRLTDRLQYPPLVKRDDTWYSLTDGTGLQAFAAVVSSQPLPSFREWTSQHGPPPCWQKELPGDPDVVWQDDGERTLTLTADATDSRRLRGKGARIHGTRATVAELGNWLRSRPGVDGVAVQAFTVEAADGP
jgi:serine/threonine protein kinase